MKHVWWFGIFLALGSFLAVTASSEDAVPRPATEDALAVAGTYLKAVAAERFEEAASTWDPEATLERMYPEKLKALREIERREAIEVMRTFLEQDAAHLHATVEWPDALRWGEALETKTVSDDLVAVHFKVRMRKRDRKEEEFLPSEIVLLLAQRENECRIVDSRGAGSDLMTQRIRNAYADLGIDEHLLYIVWALTARYPPGDSAATAPPPPPAPEWASLDAGRLELAVPVVPGAPIDQPVPNPRDLPWGERLTFHLTGAGDLFVREAGRRSKLLRLELAADGPDAQTQALKQVAEILRQAASQEGLRDESGASALRLLVRADAGARWQHVFWLLALCREPGIGIRHAGIAVDRGEEPRAGLHALDLQPAPASEEHTLVRVKAFRRGMEDPDRAFTAFKIGPYAVELPRDGGDRRPRDPAVAAARAEAFTRLRSTLRDYRKDAPGLCVTVETPLPKGLGVPHEDIVEVLGILRAEGIPLQALSGTPLPWERGDLEDPEAD